MEENLKLTLFVQANHFEEWLRQFVPYSGEYFEYKEINGETSIYISNPNVINGTGSSKIVGSPLATTGPQGDRQFEIELCQGSLEKIASGKGVSKRIPFLKIVRLSLSKTEILMNMNPGDIHAYYYIKELIRHIAETYPETRRGIHFIDPRSTLVMDKKIFEYWLKINPKYFINWCDELLRETYPGGFYKEGLKEDTITHIQQIILPKDDDVLYWEIIFYATVFIFPKNQIFGKPYVLDRDIVASIRVTPINNNEIHTKCFCELDNDQVIDWLKNLKTEIEKSPFQKSTGSNKTEDKAEEIAKNQSKINNNKKLRAKGPSIDTQQKFLIFKEYKDKNPSLTQSEVAEAVNKELGTDYSADNVSYSYKKCGHKWERGGK